MIEDDGDWWSGWAAILGVLMGVIYLYTRQALDGLRRGNGHSNR